MPNGRPQQRTLELIPHDKCTYAKDVHPALMETENLQGLLTADVCDSKYTYRCRLNKVSYKGAHKLLLPFELAEWFNFDWEELRRMVVILPCTRNGSVRCPR